MICEITVKKYCCEDISLIENYTQAIADDTQTWECHHRGEVLPCGRFNIEDLDKFGLYWKRPAAELIFLTRAEHTSLHKNGVPRGPMREEHKKAISEALINSPKRSKKILQFTKSGEFLREWPSMNEAERELGIASSSICDCCNDNRKSAGGFIWEYAL